MGKRIGYVRVSTVDQNELRQLEDVEFDKSFVDKASGKDTDRPALTQLLEFVREGDHVIVHSMDRLARNLDHLRLLVTELNDKGVSVEFVKENLVFTGDDSSVAKLLLSVMGAFAEFERNLIRERQAEGIAIAKAEGKYKGRKNPLTGQQIIEIKQAVELGISKTVLAKQYRVSRTTIYKSLE